MVFVIDMVNGEVLEDSSGESLLSIVEPDFAQPDEIKMPESIAQINIDSFLENFN